MDDMVTVLAKSMVLPSMSRDCKKGNWANMAARDALSVNTHAGPSMLRWEAHDVPSSGPDGSALASVEKCGEVSADDRSRREWCIVLYTPMIESGEVTMMGKGDLGIRYHGSTVQGGTKRIQRDLMMLIRDKVVLPDNAITIDSHAAACNLKSSKPLFSSTPYKTRSEISVTVVKNEDVEQKRRNESIVACVADSITSQCIWWEDRRMIWETTKDHGRGDVIVEDEYVAGEGDMLHIMLNGLVFFEERLTRRATTVSVLARDVSHHRWTKGHAEIFSAVSREKEDLWEWNAYQSGDAVQERLKQCGLPHVPQKEQFLVLLKKLFTQPILPAGAMESCMVHIAGSLSWYLFKKLFDGMIRKRSGLRGNVLALKVKNESGRYVNMTLADEAKTSQTLKVTSHVERKFSFNFMHESNVLHNLKQDFP
ncbi:uncharacterized protein EV420DRAFT_1486836 [Desarmillaria tabescens]|uniref:Uncharacterized protein n=1 Tax=Armillaria tabescens TaxID=1929756 RepID=A0AA39J8F8_ARMTA|nr:uncharacterized protein EV420DRAFT_1486836 [Desarmillaria tabescens]KAK0437963.1 hypothetical protein EV420DRAFT_1486836 [Desarmillaria tabescens]